jgi:hypothetical protein
MVHSVSRSGVLLVGAIVAVGLSVLAWHWRERIRYQAFLNVREGASEASVIAAFGQPQEVRQCGDSLWWGDDFDYRGKNDGRCTKWMIFRQLFDAYGVGFDAQGRVVSKYEYVSE